MTVPKATKLSLALESGKPVGGLQGYIRLQESENRQEVYAKVKAVGLGVDECNVLVRVKLMSGVGELLISPCQWLDSAADIKAKRKYEARMEAMKADFRDIHKRPHYLHERRAKLMEYVEQKMKPAQRDEFYKHVRETLGVEDRNGKPPITKAHTDLVKSLAQIAVATVHGFNAEEVNWRYWS